MDWKQNSQKSVFKKLFGFLTEATWAHQYFQCFDFIFIAYKLTFPNPHITVNYRNLVEFSIACWIAQKGIQFGQPGVTLGCIKLIIYV